VSSVAVIGLGAMGSRLARRLVDAGLDVVVWNQSPDKARNLVAAGAAGAETPVEATRRSQTVITMVAARGRQDYAAVLAQIGGAHPA
jgi:3-hydroxyisobutyrate dehydrogenase-like beta-hydroxyacid dehydrogenase